MSQEPSVVEAKERRFWNCGGHGKEDWSVVGGWFGPRGESGDREGGGMSQVNKGPVELGQDRRVLTIGPCEIAPKQRNFHNPQIADSIVESRY